MESMRGSICSERAIAAVFAIYFGPWVVTICDRMLDAGFETLVKGLHHSWEGFGRDQLQ